MTNPGICSMTMPLGLMPQLGVGWNKGKCHITVKVKNDTIVSLINDTSKDLGIFVAIVLKIWKIIQTD